MQNYGFGECNNFFEFISVLALLLSYIFFVIQSFYNTQFISSNSNEIIAERQLYKHFSEDIYTNIRRKSFTKINQSEIKNSNSQYLNLEVKLDTFFDCQGIKKGLLNEVCQNTIINNLTCCRSDCCIKKNEEILCNNYNFNLKKIFLDNKILNYNDEERFEDPRRRYCKYFNKYTGLASKILNNYLQIDYFEYSYEDLFLKKEIQNLVYIGKESPDGYYTDCGILDTLNNHLFLKDMSCPLNFILRDNNNLYFDSITYTTLGIIVRNFLSEIPPNIHEWYNGFINEIDEKKNITIKDINKIIKENYNNYKYYRKQEAYFYINELPEFNEDYKDKINKYQKIYWYSTNYIGFNSADDLKQFKQNFNESNNKDNPLYNITQSLYPLGTPVIIIGIILIVFCLVYIIIFILKVNIVLKQILFIIKEIIIGITFFTGFIIYIIYTTKKYYSIDINIDEHYKEILNLYNKRRIQKYYLTGIIFMGFVIFYEIYFIFLANKNMKSQKIDMGSDISNSKFSYRENKLGNNKISREEHIYKENDLIKLSIYESRNIKRSVNNINSEPLRLNQRYN